jgi:hypothetical protein
MEKEFEKIIDREDIVRDTTNRALLNVDTDGLRSYKARRAQAESVLTLDKRMEMVEASLVRTEEMLKNIITTIKSNK